MRRTWVVGLFIGALLIVSPVLVGAGPSTDERVAVLETQVAELRAIHGLTEEPTETATLTATTPAPTATATASQEPQQSNSWHAPTDHEHGDAPPAWAEAWSIQQFGHGVIYGGDESTPGENVHKHNAFKGFAFNALMADGSTAQVYARLHAQSNPHGRSGRYHSYEIYVKDATGAISFWQGWADFGDAPANRYSHTDQTFTSVNSGQGVPNLIFGYDQQTTYYEHAREEWYSRNDAAEWSWTIEIQIHDPSTYINPETEHLTATDQGTWQPTGAYGLDRGIRMRWISEGGAHPTSTQIQTRNMENPRGWFCTDVYGVVLSTGSKDCGSGLPQYIALTMPETNPTWGIYSRKVFGCSSCSLPN